MNHGNKINRLGRNAKHRKAMLRTMVTQLLKHERIETTLAKAKVLKQFTDKIISMGKRNSQHSRRAAEAFIRTRPMVDKVFNELAERYRNRPGGYTRVLRSRVRKDTAVMAYIELVDRPGELRFATPCGPDYVSNPVPRRNRDNKIFNPAMLERFQDLPEEILEDPIVDEDPYEDPKQPLL